MGEWTKFMPATAETQDIADKVKVAAEEKLSMKFEVYKAFEYQSQVVAGMNYRINVQISNLPGNAELGVFQNLEHEYALTSAKLLPTDKK
ncbi:cystatin-B-like [Dysidea avara]|uniref:cystatin-B-like n=1 Tax=Dysidea avara TaxID=196820 RepID=UPI00331B152B